MSPRKRLGRQHIEGRERLVEQQHVGIDDKRARKADALPHAARKLLGIGGFEAVEADQIDRRDGALPPLVARHALRLEAKLDIPQHGEPREKREALEHHRDALGRSVDRLAAIGDRAFARRGQAGDDAQESRLARARFAENGDDLAFLQREVDVIENQPAGMIRLLIGLADPRGRDEAGFDGGCGRVHLSIEPYQSSRSRSSARW